MSIFDYWPVDYEPRIIQIKALQWLEKQNAKHLFLEAPVGCHLKGTLILSHNGSTKNVEDVMVGDYLMGPDNLPRTVTALHRGNEMMYTINPFQGDQFVVNKNHILSLVKNSNKYNEVINISVKEYLNKPTKFKTDYKLYRSLSVQLPKSTIDCDWYDLGFELGTTDRPDGINPKHQIGSIDQRFKLLAGLLDASGKYIETKANYCFKFKTESKTLARDTIFISRSLGFSANSVIDDTDKYTVKICGILNTIPTKLEKNNASVRLTSKPVNVTGFDVSEYGVDDFYGFEVDSDHLYLMGDFTVTHNSGKSLIGLTYSAYLANKDKNLLKPSLGSSYILTPQKILQAQYENEQTNLAANSIGSFYGKANYQCAKNSCNCETGTIVGRCDPCTYTVAKNRAISTANTVLNYKLGLASFTYTDSYPRRDLMVLDECHNAEDYLTEFDAIMITEKRCIKYGIKWVKQRNIESAYEWVVKTYAPEFLRIADDWMQHNLDTVNGCRRGTTSKSDRRVLTEYKQLEMHIEEVKTLCSKPIQTLINDFVLVTEAHKITFKRLNAGYSFKSILSNKASRFLFMSSTILDYSQFCNDLGIDSSDAAFLSLQSEFPVANRPIYYMPQMKVNKDWSSNIEGQSRMISKVNELIKDHSGDKGIIHTANFALAVWLVEQLKNNKKTRRNKVHQIFHHNPDGDESRDDVIAAFQAYKGPAILISPSITEGLDLKHDLGRFAIIVKVPFPHLGDEWIRARFNMSNAWYQRKALTGIIQGGGRVVRTSDDWGKTYILDGSWGYLKYKAGHMLPKWWKDSIIN